MFQDMSKKLSESMGPMKELVEIQTRMLEKLTRLQMECAQNCVKATMKQTQDLPECHSTEELIDLQRKFARVVEETLVKASQDNLAAFCVLAMRDQIAPPTINLDNPSDGCNLNYVPHSPQRCRIDAAISNSFGFGGTNGTLLFKQI